MMDRNGENAVIAVFILRLLLDFSASLLLLVLFF